MDVQSKSAVGVSVPTREREGAGRKEVEVITVSRRCCLRCTAVPPIKCKRRGKKR